ncbi:hypothetical protein GCM10009785_27240 [Brooklawnia cerclae]
MIRQFPLTPEARAELRRRRSRSAVTRPLAPGGRPSQPGAPLVGSSVVAGRVIVHRATVTLPASPVPQRETSSRQTQLRTSSGSQPAARRDVIGQPIRLTERGLAVVMIAFALVVVLGLVVIGAQYLSLDATSATGLS